MNKCRHCLAGYDGDKCDECGWPTHHWDYCPRCVPVPSEVTKKGKWPMARVWEEGYQTRRMENITQRRQECRKRAGS